VTIEEIIDFLKPGDVMTHQLCGGGLTEHFFIGMDGNSICGFPTTDTMLIEGSALEFNAISPKNITHINRISVSVDVLEFVKIQPHRPYAKIGESF